MDALIWLKSDKSSAVADIGDRFSTIDMGQNDLGRKNGGLLCPFPLGELGPHLPQRCRLGEAYLHNKWHLDPFNHLARIHQRYRQDRQQDIVTVA